MSSCGKRLFFVFAYSLPEKSFHRWPGFPACAKGRVSLAQPGKAVPPAHTSFPCFSVRQGPQAIRFGKSISWCVKRTLPAWWHRHLAGGGQTGWKPVPPGLTCFTGDPLAHQLLLTAHCLPLTAHSPHHSSTSARQGSRRSRGMSLMNRDGELTVIPNCRL